MKAVLLLALVAVAFAAPRAFQESQYEFLFKSWVAQHGKTYGDVSEMLHRYNIFKDNMDFIQEFNAQGHSYTVGMNAFGDLAHDEFKAKFLHLNPIDNSYYRSLNAAQLTFDAPESADWVAAGAVTPVKNQGQCGSCWAFSATGAIEGACKIFGSEGLVSLSEQELVDCAKAEGNEGCNGGLMDNAFQYVINRGKGLASEKDYAYTAKDGTCKATLPARHCHITGFADVKEKDEAALTEAIARQPVAVAIEADKQPFQFYSGGIIDSTACGLNLDHGVLAVGYGKDTTGKLFYNVKNSWGASWGEKGYVRIKRNPSSTDGGICGIALAASYPTM